MVSAKRSVAIAALAGAHLVAAQTHSLCKPTEKDCPDAPAFGDGVHTVDFTKGESSVFTPAAGTKVTYDGTKGAVFSIGSNGGAPLFISNNYLLFGRIEAHVQAAPGAGIVSSVVLQADDLDEIDFEWVGNDDKQVQSNYFSKGDDSTFDRGGYHPAPNPAGQFNNYTIEWTPKHIQWFVNGNMVRELTSDQAKGGKTFPQSPCQVRLGIWVAGLPNAPEGTAKWAGGYTDFTQAPFDGYYKKVIIQDYQGGQSGAKAYHYGDRSGTWQSVVVVKGDGSGSGGGDKASSSSSTTSAPATLSTSTTTKSDTSVTTPAPTNGGNNGGNAGNGGSGGNQTTGGAGPRPTGAQTSPTITPPNAGAQSTVSFVGLAGALLMASLFL
jgi:hypothetical protein